MSDRELNEDGTYTVQAGDTLSAIAEEFLGDGERWREVYEVNRDTIGKNPNLIKPGQELALPVAEDEPPAEEEPAEG